MDLHVRGSEKKVMLSSNFENVLYKIFQHCLIRQGIVKQIFFLWSSKSVFIHIHGHKQSYTKGIPKAKNLQNDTILYKLHPIICITRTFCVYQKKIRKRKLLLLQKISYFSLQTTHINASGPTLSRYKHQLAKPFSFDLPWSPTSTRTREVFYAWCIISWQLSSEISCMPKIKFQFNRFTLNSWSYSYQLAYIQKKLINRNTLIISNAEPV